MKNKKDMDMEHIFEKLKNEFYTSRFFLVKDKVYNFNYHIILDLEKFE